MLTKHILPIALAAGTLALSSAGSQAMPMARPGAAQIPIETVGGRCGPGWHVNNWGNCVPNRRMMIRPIHRWRSGVWFHHRWYPGY